MAANRPAGYLVDTVGKTRKFSREFKRNAVQLAELPGIPVAQVADDLGISESVLRRWMGRHGASRPDPDDAGSRTEMDLVTLRRR